MLELTNQEAYKSYFDKLVKESKFLNFFAYTKEAFEKSSSNKNRNGWCLILEPYTAGIKDNGADSVLSYNRGMFVIAKKKTNEKSHSIIESQAQIYAHKILGRMRRDRRNQLLKTGFENFSLECINPLAATGYFGVLVEFDFYYPINAEMKFDQNDWDNG